MLLTAALLVALPNLAEAKFHLFHKRQPNYSPGGHRLEHHKLGHKVPKHKAHTKARAGH